MEIKRKLLEEIQMTENFLKWIFLPGQFNSSYVWFFQEKVESICVLFKKIEILNNLNSKNTNLIFFNETMNISGMSIIQRFRNK